MTIKDFFCKPIFQNPKFLFCFWMGLTLLCSLLRFNDISNNFVIFTHSFWHAIDELPLNIPYPKEYFDLFLYGIPFTALIAPFAVLPYSIGSLFWCLASTFFLFLAIRKLDLSKGTMALIIYLSANDLFTALLHQQYNIAITAMIIFSFVFIEKKKDFWAALMIMLGFMTKLYGIVGLAFFFFSKRKINLLGGLLFWGAVLFVLPMLYSSPTYVIGEYSDWLQALLNKNSNNTYSLGTNISLLGIVRKISQVSTYSDLYLIIPGLLLFVAPYFRLKQYDHKAFRLSFLSSTLLFMLLFSTGSESCGYIAGMIAVCLWYGTTPTSSKTPIINTVLLVLCILLTSFSPSDLFPRYIRETFIVPYALKALPCALVWFKIIWEQLTQDYAITRKPLIPCKIENMDVILPCYNPSLGWDQTIIEKHAELTKILNINLRFIVVNDGSSKGFTVDALQRITTALPHTIIVDNHQNKGKGAAVRSGLTASNSELAIYTDYDFPYSTASICELVHTLEQGYDVVTSKRNCTYYQSISIKRKITSYIPRLFNFFFLGISHTDTQGGLKGFNSKGRSFLAATQIDRFLFDTEFVYRASRDADIRMSDVSVDLRKGVHLPDVKFSVLKHELCNLLRIIFKR